MSPSSPESRCRWRRRAVTPTRRPGDLIDASDVPDPDTGHPGGVAATQRQDQGLHRSTAVRGGTYRFTCPLDPSAVQCCRLREVEASGFGPDSLVPETSVLTTCTTPPRLPGRPCQRPTRRVIRRSLTYGGMGITSFLWSREVWRWPCFGGAIDVLVHVLAVADPPDLAVRLDRAAHTRARRVEGIGTFVDPAPPNDLVGDLRHGHDGAGTLLENGPNRCLAPERRERQRVGVAAFVDAHHLGRLTVHRKVGLEPRFDLAQCGDSALPPLQFVLSLGEFECGGAERLLRPIRHETQSTKPSDTTPVLFRVWRTTHVEVGDPRVLFPTPPCASARSEARRRVAVDPSPHARPPPNPQGSRGGRSWAGTSGRRCPAAGHGPAGGSRRPSRRPSSERSGTSGPARARAARSPP